MIFHFLNGYETLDNNISTDKVESEIKQLKKDISLIEKKLEDLIDLTLDGKMSKSILEKKAATLEEELQILNKTLKNKEFTAKNIINYQDIKDFLLNTIKQLQNADDLVKKAIASQFVDKIEVNKDSVDVRLTVSPFFIGDKNNEGWALFTLTPKRKKNRSSYTHLWI